MADWYGNKQFANFSSYETTPLANQASDNPQFLYPGSRIPNVYDKFSNQKTSTTVQRGFIRGLLPDVLNESSKTYKSSKVPVRRCFFQFNPNLILRSVQASSSTMMPILQDPTQILQPIPGQSSFEFQLMFNREREVAGGWYQTSDGDYKEGGRFNDSLANYGKNPPFSQEQVASLGVLVDLYVLDSIIGQSITSDMVTYVKAYTEKTKDLRKVTETGADGSTSTKTTNDSTTLNLNDAFSEDRTKRILGNTAFLSPMPIRIVFSSLFMVEGYVTASNVAFHKFTKTMIPTVCTATLNVQALYIGFAKRDSYVSQMLTDAIDVAAKAKEADQKTLDTVRGHLKNNLNISLNYFDLSQYANSSLNRSLNEAFNFVKTNNPEDIKFYSKDYYGSTKDGLNLWGNDALRSAIGRQISDISVDSLQLVFLNKSKIPLKWQQNSAEIIKAAENGQLLGTPTSSGYANNNVGYQKGIIAVVDITSLDKNTIEFNRTTDNLDKATRSEPLKTSWESSAIDLTGVPAGAVTDFFSSDLIYVVLIATMSATGPSETTTTVGTVTVTKANVVSQFNPNSSAFWQTYREVSSTGAYSKNNIEVLETPPQKTADNLNKTGKVTSAKKPIYKNRFK